MRFWQQKKWFKARLPGHVLMLQKGGFWEMDVESARDDLALIHWPSRFHRRRMAQIKKTLWKLGAPVAWIGETGRRLDRIAERALVCRWGFSQV